MFSSSVELILSVAYREAVARRHAHLTLEHVLLVLAYDPEGEAILEPWDSISLPMHVWRGFENVSNEPAWCFAVLDPHDVYRSKDPYWSERVVEQAAKFGFQADSSGRMIKPSDYSARKAALTVKLERAVRKSLKARPKVKARKK